MQDAANTYEAARARFGAASREHTAAALAYRAREIGDAEFLQARARMEAASAECDAAEAALIRSRTRTPLYRVCWRSNFGLSSARSGLIHTLEGARELVETNANSSDHWIEDAAGNVVAL